MMTAILAISVGINIFLLVELKRLRRQLYALRVVNTHLQQSLEKNSWGSKKARQ